MDKTLRIVAGTLVGSSLYVVLNWIPLVGPFIVGLTAGRIAKGRGFLVGFFSGIFGFAFLLFFVFPRWGISGNFFLMWIMLFWNFVGIVLAGLGGSFGSAARRRSGFSYQFGSGRGRIFGSRGGRGSGQGGEKKTEKDSIEAPEVLVVCPKCGGSNPDGASECDACGGAL
ncbi:MAG: zinc ribbon domain-containing protein [Candidatus Altiarchaeales archaeon]|nr:zinc ribbon domain-containing protein [Candidatus Altiarchaeota archaeon]MCG2783117.1 zinc ribbon domain-containing protein [Candidatus Altiarchaeales archaeon]